MYVKHGELYEDEAREAYKNYTKSEVVECGLIINKDNAWLVCNINISSTFFWKGMETENVLVTTRTTPIHTAVRSIRHCKLKNVD